MNCHPQSLSCSLAFLVDYKKEPRFDNLMAGMVEALQPMHPLLVHCCLSLIKFMKFLLQFSNVFVRPSIENPSQILFVKNQ